MNDFLIAKGCDYGRATAVLFNIDGVKTGFQVPNDISAELMADTLDRVAQAIRERKAVLMVPGKYAQERAEFIKRVQEEDHA